MIYPRHKICSLSCDDIGEPTSSCHLMTSGAQRLHVGSGIFSFYRKQFACLYFSFIRNVQTGSQANAAFYSMGTGFISRGYSCCSKTLTTYVQPVPRLQMNAAIILLPQEQLSLFLPLLFVTQNT